MDTMIECPNGAASPPEAVTAKRLLTMVPGASPVESGAVIVSGKTILQAGPARSTLKGFSGKVSDLGEATLVPGLLNLHSHLELSHVKGQAPQGQGFLQWVLWLIRQPLHALDFESLGVAALQMRRTGTVFVADVTGRNAGMAARALAQSGVEAFHLLEFFGFAPVRDGAMNWPNVLDQLPKGLETENMAAAGHALYSTSPETLRLAKAWDEARGKTFSIHLAEHEGEVELLATGKGAFADLLRSSVIPKDYAPSGLSPVEEADALGLLNEKTLAVHCVKLDARDIAILAARHTNVCLCPRSNAYIGVGQAPWKALKEAGINLCLGTDSLASNFDLNLWNEVRFLLERDAGFSLSDCLSAMTVNAAKAMGKAGALGVLAPGAAGGFAILPPDLERRPLI